MSVKAETLVRWYGNLSPLGKAFVDRNSDIVDMATDYAIETEDHEGDEWWSTEGLTDDDFDSDFLVFLENSSTDDKEPMCIWFELDGKARVSEPFASPEVAAAVWRRWFPEGRLNCSLIGFVTPDKAHALGVAYPNSEDVAAEGE